MSSSTYTRACAASFSALGKVEGGEVSGGEENRVVRGRDETWLPSHLGLLPASRRHVHSCILTRPPPPIPRKGLKTRFQPRNLGTDGQMDEGELVSLLRELCTSRPAARGRCHDLEAHPPVVVPLSLHWLCFLLSEELKRKGGERRWGEGRQSFPVISWCGSSGASFLPRQTADRG